MSTCEGTTMETHTKEDLEMLADYIENSFESMFPEIELAFAHACFTNDLDKQFSLCRPGYS